MDVQSVLRGAAGDRGIRVLLASGRRSDLHATLQAMIGQGGTLRSCRLRRAHFKPGRKLSACYDVLVDDAARPTPVAVSWLGDGVQVDVPTLVHAARLLRDTGVVSIFERLWTFDQASRMLVTVAPLDPAFPGLAPMSDAQRVAAVLADARAPGAAAFDRYAVLPIRYRPGQRHVLEYRAHRRRSLFAKLYRPGTSGPVAGSVTALADLVDASGVDGLRALRPAAILAELDAIVYHRAWGTALSTRLRSGRATPGDVVQAGRMLRTLHSLEPGPRSCFRARDLAGEVRAIGRACEAMTALRPDLGAAADSIVQRARDGLEAVEQEPPTVVHGDMKADHVLSDRRGITLLDTDRCALADPALDLGKLLADLRWWSWTCGSRSAAAAELLAGYEPDAGRLARARLYAVLWLVKIAARRISVADPRWATRAAEFLELGDQLLGAGAAA